MKFKTWFKPMFTLGTCSI